MSGILAAVGPIGWKYSVVVGQGASPNTDFGFSRAGGADPYGSVNGSTAAAAFKQWSISHFTSRNASNEFEFILTHDATDLNADSTFRKLIVIGSSQSYVLNRSSATHQQLSLTGNIWTWSVSPDVWTGAGGRLLVSVE